MKAAELLAHRQESWRELELLCVRISNTRRINGTTTVRFAALYRAVCADLALADAYQLPPGTIEYLHRLVARAHHQLYRSRSFRFREWGQLMLHEVPQRVFHDRCVQFAFVFFWSIFLLSAYLSFHSAEFPNFAENVLGEAQISQLESNFSEPLGNHSFYARTFMASFYIYHNTGLGLKAFAMGLLIVPGLQILKFNAVHLGASFGYMARPEVAGTDHFFEFVTAHGPFELTAIVLAAGAGLRLGLAWIWTRGYSRMESLTNTIRVAMPVMASSMILFFLAAIIEAFISPSPLPYFIKGTIAVVSSTILVVYFVVLGYPRRDSHAV